MTGKSKVVLKEKHFFIEKCDKAAYKNQNYYLSLLQ
jgi:hypothetical protein